MFSFVVVVNLDFSRYGFLFYLEYHLAGTLFLLIICVYISVSIHSVMLCLSFS